MRGGRRRPRAPRWAAAGRGEWSRRSPPPGTGLPLDQRRDGEDPVLSSTDRILRDVDDSEVDLPSEILKAPTGIRGFDDPHRAHGPLGRGVARVRRMLSVDQPALDPRVVARAHRAVEPLHNVVYFAPEHDQRLTVAGLRPGRMCYFAGRAAPMGAVGPGVVAATFYNFSPALVARHIPRAWTLAAPELVVAARFDAARASLTRLLGEDVAGSPEVAELAGLLREACSVLRPEARPLYAGHADLPWPDEPVPQPWPGPTLLPAPRAGGPPAVVLRRRLCRLGALVTPPETGPGFPAQG